jgi:hypothetical protein
MPAGGRTGGPASGSGGATYQSGRPAGTVLDRGATTSMEEGPAGAGVGAATGRGRRVGRRCASGRSDTSERDGTSGLYHA